MTLLAVGCFAAGIVLLMAGINGGSHDRSRRKGQGRVNFERVRFAAGVIGLFVLTAILAAGLFESGALALTFGTIGAGAPFVLICKRKKLRARRIREQWPDALAMLVAHLRSGGSLPEACMYVADFGPAELRASFDVFGRSYRAFGSFQESVQRLRKAIDDPVGDRVCDAMSIAYEVGGSEIVPLFSTLSEFVRNDLRLRKEIEARWSWTINTARVAAFAPVGVLLLMATRPQAAAVYRSPTGIIVISIGALVTAAAYLAMIRIARLPEGGNKR